ncbi:unnamed protein product, partial [marine sediment metagenome]
MAEGTGFTFDPARVHGFDGKNYEFEEPLTREEAQKLVTEFTQTARHKGQQPALQTQAEEMDEVFGGMGAGAPPRSPPPPETAYADMDSPQKAYEDERRRVSEMSKFGQAVSGVKGGLRKFKQGMQQIVPGGVTPTEEEIAQARGMTSGPWAATADLATMLIPGVGVEAGIAKLGAKLPAALRAVKLMRTPRT